MEKRLAIIPARGGSKRIPKKNIKAFLGRPVISYSINAALNTKLFDEIIVSTDDVEIATMAEKYGAKVPFYRSEKNSDDHATTAEVLTEVVDVLEKSGKIFDVACCIYPAAPLIKFENIIKGYQILRKENRDSVFPVIEFGSPIKRAFIREVEGKTSMIWPEYINSRSQDIDVTYHDAGHWYWFDVAVFKKKRQIFTENVGSLVLESIETQDINDLNDWKLAELKYLLMNKYKLPKIL